MRLTPKFWGLYQLFFGILTLFAVGTQLRIHIAHDFNVVNFFSYYTNLTNIASSIIFLIIGDRLLREQSSTRGFEALRGYSVVNMVLVGVVFNTLLLNVELGSLLPWVNNVLHRLMPLAVLIEWIFRPTRVKIPKSWILFWLVPPLLYLAYSLIRGPLVEWYAYPFFDPEKVGGPLGVTAYCLAMFVGVLVTACLTRHFANRRSDLPG